MAEFHSTGSSDETDREWSEYNHHWAGLIVLAAGLLAFLSRFRGMHWARFWPLSFAGLSVFILLRADPENWPLGPRPFWASFSSPDVLQHRAAAVLILCFAAFECAVQAGKLRVRWASMIFPAMCALGAAVLLTHNHAPSDVQEDLLASLSHTPIALLGATAGWGRWLELRLPPGRAVQDRGLPLAALPGCSRTGPAELSRSLIPSKRPSYHGSQDASDLSKPAFFIAPFGQRLLKDDSAITVYLNQSRKACPEFLSKGTAENSPRNRTGTQVQFTRPRLQEG